MQAGSEWRVLFFGAKFFFSVKKKAKKIVWEISKCAYCSALLTCRLTIIKYRLLRTQSAVRQFWFGRKISEIFKFFSDVKRREREKERERNPFEVLIGPKWIAKSRQKEQREMKSWKFDLNSGEVEMRWSENRESEFNWGNKRLLSANYSGASEASGDKRRARETQSW